MGIGFSPVTLPMAPMYNTNLVSPAEAPQSWEDLLDPKREENIGMTTDPKAWAALAVADEGWGIEKTEAFLRELKKQNIIWTSGHCSGFTLLIAGEFKIHAV